MKKVTWEIKISNIYFINSLNAQCPHMWTKQISKGRGNF